jgi:hypothetical protein
MSGLKKGQKIVRKSDGKIFTFEKTSQIGFGMLYVEELNAPIYQGDFDLIESKSDNTNVKKLYIVMVYNENNKNWEMATGFLYNIEDAEKVIKTMFTSLRVLADKPTIQIFYTLDVYSEDLLLISFDDKEQIIIKGGLFTHE